MESIIKNITDPYERKARLYPAFLALTPIFIALAIYTEWTSLGVENALYLFLVSAAMFWLSGFSRKLGKDVEAKLMEKWGVLPSISMLRHRDSDLDRYTKSRYHRSAEVLLQGVEMPSQRDEDLDLNDADEKYKAVTKALLQYTRGQPEKYSLLLKENINYGFQRNLLGVRKIALLICAFFAAFSFWIYRDAFLEGHIPDERGIVALVASFIIPIFWLFSTSEYSVLQVAKEYAKRLLEVLDEFSD